MFCICSLRIPPKRFDISPPLNIRVSYLVLNEVVMMCVAVSRPFKENLNTPRPSEHPPVRGENVKTFSRWDHRLQIQHLFMAFKRVPRW